MSTRRLSFCAGFFVTSMIFSSAVQGGGDLDVPLQQWTAAPFWRPPADPTPEWTKGSTPGPDARPEFPTEPMPYVAVTPCRLIDTRAGSTLPSGWGAPSLVANTNAGPISADRAFVATATTQCPDIPAGARAVAANVTAIGFTAAGRLTVYPADAATRPSIATVNYRVPVSYSPTVAQVYGILPLDGTGSFRAFTNAATDLLVDLNGYYAPANTFCLGGDCRTSWNGQDANSVSPLPRDCPVGQIVVSTGSYQWKCSNLCTAAGMTDCGGPACTATATDPNNCGACGTVCSSANMASRTCGSGVCNGECAAGYGDCNGNRQSDGCEVNLATDPNNCGLCGAVCSSNHVASRTCVSGVCNGLCTAPWANCNGNMQSDGCEVSLDTSTSNCGTCGHVCTSGQTCTNGVCG